MSVPHWTTRPSLPAGERKKAARRPRGFLSLLPRGEWRRRDASDMDLRSQGASVRKHASQGQGEGNV